MQNYVAQESQVNLDTEVNNYDLTMEMLFNLRFAEDSGLFLEEVVPEVQEVEPAEQAEEGKAAEEEFLKANFEDSVPQLEDLSEKGYARANAMLFWAYYFGYEDYPGDPQKALKYAKKGSDAAARSVACCMRPIRISRKRKSLSSSASSDRRCARWQMQRTIWQSWHSVHVISMISSMRMHRSILTNMKRLVVYWPMKCLD